MELGQRVTFARVLVSVDVASFYVIVGQRREHGEEDEARMLDVLSRTLDDQVEASVRADQLLDQLLPGHLLLVPFYRSMVMLFGLVLFFAFETYRSTSSQMLIFSDRSEIVRKFDCFQVVRGALVCPGTQIFPMSKDNYSKNARSPLRNMESTFTFGQSLGVSHVSNDDHLVGRAHVW